MTTNNAMVAIEKLVGRDNWASWSFAVKAYLQHEELWDCIDNAASVDPKKDLKAKSKLILLVDPINYVHIQDATTAKEVWNNLSQAFQDSGLLRKVGLLKDLINTTLETSTSVEDYVNKILSAAHKLRNISFQVDDEWLGTLMLAGLPDEYKPMIMGIESSGVKISADLIKTKLLQEVKQSVTTAFYSNSKKNPKNNHTKSKGPRCFHCNKYGHMSKNCWHKKNKSENKNFNEENKNGFIAAFSAMKLNDCTHWYVDSGASAHMTMHREWLENETDPPVRNIKIADNKLLNVEKCGNVTIQVPFQDGSMRAIQVKNVLYVPELSTNLLAVSKIIKNGCKVEFNKNGCMISDQNGQNLASASLINDTYRLNSSSKTIVAMTAAAATNTYLWHQRMGHLNFSDVNKIPNCATGVKLSPQMESCICISCLEGKQTRQPFPSNGSRAKQLLELIHTDVCGPMQVASCGGARYFATFTDDYSRKVFVYFMKSKAEVLEKFIEFKNRVENELDKKIKTIRSDNGKEYINRNFDLFLKKHGILHQTSNPYTPEQNGLSERMNRTLIERAKCMILNSDLQKDFWAEAVSTAAYIINRSPTRALADITPEEVWTGTQPDLSHMRVFGCSAMVHIPKEKRQKLDAKSCKLIFVGYSDCTKGYRFIDPKSKRALMSRDVVFLEESVKRNMLLTSPSETKKEINKCENNMSKMVITSSETKTEINKSENNMNKMDNKTYLPLCSYPLEDPRNEYDDVQDCDVTSPRTPINHTDISSSANMCNDDTYVPDERFDTPDFTMDLRPRRRRQEMYENSPTSYLCMNAESASSLLNNDPQSLDEALKSSNANEWMEAMKNEYKSLIENNTWSMVDLPCDKKVIPCKWVYKTKLNEYGEVVRFKARLVIKGFQQKKGIDYNDVYAPVVRYTSIRYLFGLATKYQLNIHQMDAVTAFLQGDIDQEIYMTQPPCFEQGEEVCRLNKSIYGLKQASRLWNQKLNNVLLEIGMSRSKMDPCIYFRILNKDDILFISVYVDDLLCLFNNNSTGEMIKAKLKEKFQMKDMGEAKQCIGFRITRKGNRISLDQSIYIHKLLTRFNMNECKPVWTPCDANVQLKKAESKEEILKDIPYQEAVGCLLYLSQGTRPDIAYIVNMLSRFNNQPTAQHWCALKRVLRYLKATINHTLSFIPNKDNIVGYCDADWASHSEDRRSCTGYIFLFQGAAISWCCKRQQTVALSSTEAEYMSLASSIQEALWLKQLEEEFWPELSATSLLMNCDNKSAISLSGAEGYRARSKHIDVRYHFIREKISTNQVSVKYVKSEEMVADALTKALHRPKHETFLSSMEPTQIESALLELELIGVENAIAERARAALNSRLAALGARVPVTLAKEKAGVKLRATLTGPMAVDVVYHIENMVKQEKLSGADKSGSASLGADVIRSEYRLASAAPALHQREILTESTVSAATSYHTALIVLAATSAFIISVLCVLVMLYRARLQREPHKAERFLPPAPPVYVLSADEKAELARVLHPSQHTDDNTRV